MYLPRSFEETRVEVMHALLRAHPLATLITFDGAALTADHVPMHLSGGPAPFGLLQGHVARANPLWRQAESDREALAVFQGPQAYISPSLYPSKRTTGKVVPTWDYAVVHAYGRLRFIHEEAWLRDLVTRLTDVHEAARPAPWKLADAPSEYVTGMLHAIVGFEFSVTRMSGKWKVSQNRDAQDRRGVVDGLREAGDTNSAAIAAMLESR